MAKKLFGQRRFEEIMGELWLQERRILERAGPEPADMARVLLEWEDRFRRDVEEGRYQYPRGRRNRVTRLSEFELEHTYDNESDPMGWDSLHEFIRRTW